MPHLLGCDAPHLVYLPEAPFDPDQFVADVTELQKDHKAIIIAVSEGIRFENGLYVAMDEQSGMTDAFGHKYLAGSGKYLEKLVMREFGCKVRSIELNLPQRCAGHLLSKTDIEESAMVGRAGVRCALEGHSGQIMIIRRTSNDPYAIEIGHCDIQDVANLERNVPDAWINEAGNGITDELYDYMEPLIEGELDHPTVNGLPCHFRFDKTDIVSK